MNALLLSFHIAAGGVALVAAGVAVATAKGGCWHVACGRDAWAGAIGALTAFTVVNVHAEPAFIPWLAPTVLLTPLLFYWAARVQRSGLPETRSPRTPRAA
jgi:hypothetical protein